MSFLASDSHRCKLMFFHWRMSDSKSPLVFRNLLSILPDLDSSIVWMVLNVPLIYNFSNIFPRLWETFPSIPVTIGITLALLLHRFFSFQATPRCLSFSFFIYIHSVLRWNSKIPNTVNSLLFVNFWPEFGDLFAFKIPEKFKSLILKDWLWFEQMAFDFIIIFSLRIFHISFSWWFLTGVWVTAGLLKFPGPFSVFWLFPII